MAGVEDRVLSGVGGGWGVNIRRRIHPLIMKRVGSSIIPAPIRIIGIIKIWVDRRSVCLRVVVRLGPGRVFCCASVVGRMWGDHRLQITVS